MTTITTQSLAEARQSLLETDDFQSIEFPLREVEIDVRTDQVGDSEVILRLEGEGVTLAEFAKKNLCSELGIPAEYFLRCPIKLQASQLDYWQDHVKDTTRRRAVVGDGAVHGITSPNYFPIKGAPLLDTSVEIAAQGDEENVSLDFFEHSWTHTRLSLSNRSNNHAVDNEHTSTDEVRAGFTIINSLVNKHKTEAQPFFFRAENDTRLSTPVLSGAEHEVFRYDVTAKTDPTDWLSAALDSCAQNFGPCYEAFDASAKEDLSDVDKVIAAQETHVPGYLREKVEDAYAAEQIPTVWGIVCALISAVRDTDVARSDHRLAVERHAGWLAVNRSCDECRRAFTGE